MVAAEVGERLGDPGFRLRGDVLPDAAVRQFLLGRQGIVGVDRVAAMHEEVGRERPHRLVDRHAADLGIDTPALAHRVRRPDEAHVAGDRRRRAETAPHPLARCAAIREVFIGDAVEDRLAGRQARQPQARRVVGILEGVRSAEARRPGQAFLRGILDDHARRPVRPAPQGRAVAPDVARLHALQQAGAAGRIRLGKDPVGQGGERACAQHCPPLELWSGHGPT